MDRQSVILMPYNYINKLSSKNFWSKTAKAFNYWIQAPGDKFDLISEVVTLLHNASLIIDDIEDRSPMRRGAKSAHEVFGVPMTLNSGNYVYFLALQKLQELDNFDAIEIFTTNMLLLHEGQGCDISYRDNFVWLYQNENSDIFKEGNALMNFKDNFAWPKESEYESVMVKKTSGLVRMVAELLYQYAGAKVDGMDSFSILAERMGLCFQMWDDLMNITSPRFTDAKGFAADLDEGTFTFPIINALNNLEFSEKLMKMLMKSVKSHDDKVEILELLKASGSIEHTRDRVLEILKEIREDCDKLGENPLMDEFLSQFFVMNLQ